MCTKHTHTHTHKYTFTHKKRQRRTYDVHEQIPQVPDVGCAIDTL